MKCGDLMHIDLQWVPGDANARDVARIMRDRSLGFLLIHAGTPGRLAGVVTDRDLAVRVCAGDRRPEDVRIIDIASTDVVTCEEGQSLKEAEAKMRTEQKSRLVVLNAAGNTVGILSLTDILLGDSPRRALKTARGVLAREAEGPHTPLDQIKLTPSTPEDEEATVQHRSVTVGRRVDNTTKEFP